MAAPRHPEPGVAAGTGYRPEGRVYLRHRAQGVSREALTLLCGHVPKHDDDNRRTRLNRAHVT